MKDFSKLYGVTYHKITRTARFVIRRHSYSRAVLNKPLATRVHRAIRRNLNKMHTRGGGCNVSGVDETYLDPLGIRRLAWKREMNGPRRNRRETLSSRFCNANHRAHRVIPTASREEMTSRFKVNEPRGGFSGINICLNTIIYIRVLININRSNAHSRWFTS